MAGVGGDAEKRSSVASSEKKEEEEESDSGSSRSGSGSSSGDDSDEEMERRRADEPPVPDLGAPVQLYVYDLTRGMAAVMSHMLLGRHVEGIWHSAVVAYGREYFFGSNGVQSCNPGGTVLGDPDRVIDLGETYIPYPVFLEYILGLGESTFRPISYDIFSHNCNNFSHEVGQFLCGKGIPKYILDLPEEVLSTPLGQSLRPVIDSLNQISRGVGINTGSDLRNYTPQDSRRSRQESPEFAELNSAIEEVRRNSVALEERRNVINEKLAKKDRKKKKKKKREKKRIDQECGSSSAEFTPDSASSSPSRTNMADSVIEAPEEQQQQQDEEEKRPQQSAADVVAEIEAEERKEREERKKQREPPIVFKDVVSVPAEFDSLVDKVENILNAEERQSLEELHQYMLEDEGSWALGDGFLNFVGRVLHDTSLNPEVRVHLLNLLAAAALKDDVILLLHQDRREHVLMNYAHDVDRLTQAEQESLALFICNMFENLSSSEWLLYISEWEYCGRTISNIRVTTKVAVHSLLSDIPLLQERGSAIIHNLACKEVFDDVAVELTMALLQFFNSSPPEEHLFRCMKALARFCHIASQDVPQLIQMIGPEPTKFRGTSERIDALIDQIASRLH
ncbi:uncharacterized protein LOC124774896 isoform X2 [Schistocerca piceifrons]|uniref:uncharacterized protein LOC124774896 isoform X2 n=1 Tax=Schistocerca piceifrons TaxID=274613 RepID=UPI001F5E464C|nr:uncharacterized protein LOC124774896 isoform X2 [Schistocerca piceifrons]